MSAPSPPRSHPTCWRTNSIRLETCKRCFTGKSTVVLLCVLHTHTLTHSHYNTGFYLQRKSFRIHWKKFKKPVFYTRMDITDIHARCNGWMLVWLCVCQCVHSHSLLIKLISDASWHVFEDADAAWYQLQLVILFLYDQLQTNTNARDRWARYKSGLHHLLKASAAGSPAFWACVLFLHPAA